MNPESAHNPYSPPRARVQDPVGTAHLRVKTPWGRAAEFYWAFLWRMLLIFSGMLLPFIAIYGFVQWMLGAMPLVERAVRLLCILTLLTCASCFAIQWAAKARYRGYSLRLLGSPPAADSTSLPPSGDFSFGRAARLFGSHLWRYLLAVIPVNVLLALLIARQPVLSSGWPRVLEAQAVNIVVGVLVGIWAMREALSVPYRGFRIEWVAADLTWASEVETQPAAPPNQ